MENINKHHIVIWREAYDFLKSTLPSHAVHAWFDPVVSTGFERNTLLLSVPNQFFKEWIETHYLTNLENALKKNNGSSLKYNILVSEKNDKEDNTTRNDNKTQSKKINPRINNLNSQYRFKNFIVGNNNEFAKAAAESVANNPGDTNFNPLIIYGGVGLGKTHLAHAIGVEIKSK